MTKTYKLAILKQKCISKYHSIHGFIETYNECSYNGCHFFWSNEKNGLGIIFCVETYS